MLHSRKRFGRKRAAAVVMNSRVKSHQLFNAVLTEVLCSTNSTSMTRWSGSAIFAHPFHEPIGLGRVERSRGTRNFRGMIRHTRTRVQAIACRGLGSGDLRDISIWLGDFSSNGINSINQI